VPPEQLVQQTTASEKQDGTIPEHHGDGRDEHSYETADRDTPYKRHKDHGSELVREIRKGVG